MGEKIFYISSVANYYNIQLSVPWPKVITLN